MTYQLLTDAEAGLNGNINYLVNNEEGKCLALTHLIRAFERCLNPELPPVTVSAAEIDQRSVLHRSTEPEAFTNEVLQEMYDTFEADLRTVCADAEVDEARLRYIVSEWLTAAKEGR